MMRSIAILSAILSSACLTSESVVVVQADGSGTVTNTVLLKVATIEFEKVFARPAEQSAEEYVTEDKMRAAAATMGEGVTFQSMEPLKKEGWEGARVVYAFKDVSRLNLRTGSQILWTLTEGSSELLSFRFSPAAAGAPAKLTIVTPFRNEAEWPDRKHRPLRLDDPADRAFVEQFKSVLEGGSESVVLEVAGRIVKTNADSVSGSRVPLRTVDLDQLLASGADLTWLLGIHQHTISLDEARRKMKGTKGLWMQLHPEVNVEFTPP